MELRKRVTVLVPSELVYAFDPDHEHVFIAAREKGRIVARPMEEYIALKPCDNYQGRYLPGYTAGMIASFENGYRNGFRHGLDKGKFDARLALDSGRKIAFSCTGQCTSCQFYDDINETCVDF